MKNKYQKKIVKFMQAKAKQLRRTNIEIDYCPPSVANDVLSWSNKDAKSTWKTIVHNIEYPKCNIPAEGLYSHTCPYCINLTSAGNMRCYECNYAKLTGGECYDTRSNYYRITSMRPKSFINTVFSNKFYKEIIKGIQ